MMIISIKQQSRAMYVYALTHKAAHIVSVSTVPEDPKSHNAAVALKTNKGYLPSTCTPSVTISTLLSGGSVKTCPEKEMSGSCRRPSMHLRSISFKERPPRSRYIATWMPSIFQYQTVHIKSLLNTAGRQQANLPWPAKKLIFPAVSHL